MDETSLLAVTAIGTDRPGIVAAISGALFELGCNLEDATSKVIVVDVSSHPKATTCSGTIVLVDPIVVEYSGRVVGREGCMSVPDLTANVARATEITVAGRDAAGDRVHLHAQGFEARALQHEIDHLDGMLILDRVESVTSDVFRRKVYK